MRAREKSQANVAAIFGFLSILVGFAFGYMKLGGPQISTIFAAVFAVLGDLLFLAACIKYAQSKGRSILWGIFVPIGFALLAVCWFLPKQGSQETIQTLKWAGILVTVAGVLIIAFLTDKHKWG